jgi:predicted esterase
MKTKSSPAAVVRGQQRDPPRTPWRLDGAGAATDPLVLGLHGYGMDEDFFAVLLQKLFVLPRRFLIPRATRPANAGLGAANGGSWYDYDGNQDRFREELVRVEGELLRLVQEVEREHALAPRRRHVLGFSQGGYCGAWTALRHPDVFHGLIVSGARVKTEMLDAEMKAAGAAGFRVLLCHGSRDRSVAPDAATRSRDALAAAGVNVELATFDAGHSLGREQVAVISEWLSREA